MTTQDIIQQILQKNQQISEQQLLEKLEAERGRTGGLLGDETLLRLIAAKFGVQVQQNSFHNSGVLSTGRLFAGLNDVTVAGHLIAVFPVRTFQGAEKSGKFATLMLADSEGLLRVVLWDKNADAVEKGELKAGLEVKLLHGYTRQDRYGKIELHLGGKSQIKVEPEDQDSAYPTIERFTTKIKSLNKESGNVHLIGTVKAILSRSTFQRNGESEGIVMRLALADESGEATLVVWNEKVLELEKVSNVGTRLLLVNARVKESQNGSLEVHVDSNTFIDAQK